MQTKKKVGTFLNILLSKLGEIADVLSQQDLRRVSQVFSKPRSKKNDSSFKVKLQEQSTQDVSQPYQDTISKKKHPVRKGSQHFQTHECACQKSREKYDQQSLLAYFEKKMKQFANTMASLKQLLNQVQQYGTISLGDSLNENILAPFTKIIQDAYEGLTKKQALEATRFQIENYKYKQQENQTWINHLYDLIHYELDLFKNKLSSTETELSNFRRNLDLQKIMKKKRQVSNQEQRSHLSNDSSFGELQQINSISS